MARIDERRPKRITTEVMTHVTGNRWKTLQKFTQSSLEVFWNGQKLQNSGNDYNFIDDYTVEILGVNLFNEGSVVKNDIFVCNYVVKF